MFSSRFTLGGLLTSALLLTSTWASPVGQEAPPSDPLLRKRQTAPFAVTGVQGSGVQQRLEIRDLAANADMYNIFLLGLQRMQALDQSNYLSYFQVAGIHGRPMADWNAVQGNQSSTSPGYCTHVSNLFLTWHRPYLALYEQLLVSNAKDAANTFPAGATRNKYLNAANNLRLPYWDWAKKRVNGQNALPSQLTDSTVNVVTPTGTRRISNPLYSYRFNPPSKDLYYSIYQTWRQTLRWPTSTNSDASSQTSQVISAVNSNQQQYQQRVYNILTQYNNFMDMTNEPFIKAAGPLQYDSLESIHDSLHSTIGGPNYGHMDIVDVSAFDPIFWLHHAMVDRVFAMWQALWPNSYVEAQSQAQSSYWYNEGQTLDQNTALLPFHSSTSGAFWTSTSIRDHKVFGYTYPELVSGNTDTLKAAINNLYGSSTTRKRSVSPFRGEINPQNGQGDFFNNWKGVVSSAMNGRFPTSATAPPATATPSAGSSPNNTTTDNSLPRDYLTNIRAPKNALGGSYNIHVFIGEPTPDPTGWPLDSKLVGTYGVISMLDANAMANILVGGTIPLTKKLEDLQAAGQLADLKQGTVEPYLKDNLTWRVRNANGTVIDAATVPGLAISVVSVQVQPPKSNSDFPKWKTNMAAVLAQVTVDKEGGINVAAEG